MTMETNLSKRDWIKELWDETEGNDAARDLIFGGIIEDMETHAEEIADAREDEIRDEVRDEIKEDLKHDPPDDLRARVIKDLLECPPDRAEEGFRDWEELEEWMLIKTREAVKNEIGDLELTIETLQEEIAGLKGIAYKPPEKGKTWR